MMVRKARLEGRKREREREKTKKKEKGCRKWEVRDGIV